MSSLIKIELDKGEIQQLCRKQIAEIVKDVDAEYIFWDAKELQRRTCMSWNFIQDTFFHDRRFIKRKIGNKWYFPVKETRTFLTEWLIEQE
ncbi:group-specific protein [Paenibacillus sp. WLX2291]|uniref:group-specific protein n=1 Tax=Paenibacillus sp. WLX2291 TaxID=3296934 RepID=UPI0039845F66